MSNTSTNKKNTPPTLGTVQEGNLLGLNQQEAQAPVVNTNLAGLFDSIGPFTAGIFLDNDKKHRDSVKEACNGKIETPKIAETNKFEFEGIPIQSFEYVALLKELSAAGIDAARIMSRLRLQYSNGIEMYDKKSGIQIDEVHEIMGWVEKQEENQSALGAGAGAGEPAKTPHLVAIFDFDRTISMMEGGFFMANSVQAIKKRIFEMFSLDDEIVPYIPTLTIEGFAEYLAGGQTRMETLQDMFDFLYDHNVKIVLLTNNSGCSNARGFFQEMMMVYTKGRPVEIICGMDFDYRKGRAILGRNTNTGNLKSLRDMCIQSGGKRNRKSRKQMRKRRQTKKH